MNNWEHKNYYISREFRYRILFVIVFIVKSILTNTFNCNSMNVNFDDEGHHCPKKSKVVND
ncbi:hypothetical protein DERP_003297 [Dermatophagoides pteronyssinus]|uniref:Uncharacterized protein n=1 Tax=Dermatophagoides pteronyssinus TaxID=6956 RepID=A0ABQ8JJN7_DERPT|nr:hypothetical protein DERP_003297 [Dermatophagoides pteronyssinus]